MLLHGIDASGVEILQLGNDISDHYLVSCIFHIAKAVKPTPCYNMVEPSPRPQKAAL